MSILNVEHLTHGFGDRAIFSDVSFRLLKGEHIGLVGANGEGKSTFMSIVTGKLMPDEGKVEWAKNVHAGYLDQHAVLEKGMTIQEVLKSAFDPLLQKEQRMNEICDLLGSADEEEMNVLMEELGTPKEAAADLMYNLLDRKIQEQATTNENNKKNKKGITLLAVLAILSTPVTVPLFIAMLAVLLAVAICVVCVIISDFIAALSVLLIGGKLLVRGLVSFPYSLSGALMITGCGLLGIGCSLLLYILGIYLCKWMGILLVKLAQCLARKRGKNHEKNK